MNMNGWMVALLIVIVVYIAGVVGFLLGLPASPQRGVLALAWPFTVLWMIFGNVQ
jgi:hypothetical protein